MPDGQICHYCRNKSLTYEEAREEAEYALTEVDSYIDRKFVCLESYLGKFPFFDLIGRHFPKYKKLFLNDLEENEVKLSKIFEQMKESSTSCKSFDFSFYSRHEK